MTGVGARARAWFTPRRKATPVEPVTQELSLSPPPEPDLFALAEGLEDGALCPASLLNALADLIAARRAENGVQAGPPALRMSGLRVRRADLPDWWRAGANLLLVGEGSPTPELKTNLFVAPPRRSVLAIGRESRFWTVTLGLDGAIVAVGDETTAGLGDLNCYGRSTVVIGEGTTCTHWVMLDCRNGGIIVTGSDGMWANGVSLMTDDTHAIRDAATGKRLNTFGGRIIIDRHVWLCEQARVLDGASIGPDSIVGAGSLIKRRVVPPNSVAVGVPARIVRSGVTWSREDTP